MLRSALLTQLRYWLGLVIRVLHCPDSIIKIRCIAICFGCKNLTHEAKES